MGNYTVVSHLHYPKPYTVGFTIEGLAEGGITCSLGLMQSRQGQMPRFRGDIATGGLALYYAWYSYVKRKEDDESKGEGGKKGVFGGVSHQTKLKFTAKDSIVLVEPFSFVKRFQEYFNQTGEKPS